MPWDRELLHLEVLAEFRALSPNPWIKMSTMPIRVSRTRGPVARLKDQWAILSVGGGVGVVRRSRKLAAGSRGMTPASFKKAVGAGKKKKAAVVRRFIEHLYDRRRGKRKVYAAKLQDRKPRAAPRPAPTKYQESYRRRAIEEP
jgi:hypothetical protein